MTALPLLAGAELDAPLAWSAGRPITRRQYLADVADLAERLPADGAVLSLTADRYRFAVGLAAAMLRGHASLLPPNHTEDMIGRLRAQFDGVYALVDADTFGVALPSVRHAPGHAAPQADAVVPLIAADGLAARVLTSGSTGTPMPHDKRWGLLVANARAEAERLAQSMGRADLAGVALVATVPAQHMYGFESSVLIALLGGAAFDAGRPFYPADIVSALARVPRPRLLVTTPFHLKTLLESGVAPPPVDLVLCATAPLAPQLAARAETAFAAPLVEIYGCTEAGQVASRRTTDGPEWQTLGELRLEGEGDAVTVGGGHVPEPTRLADVLEVLEPTRFRLLGRSSDLINIAGKRSSLSHLNHHLNAIDGVLDGAFWMPTEDDASAAVVRLSAFVVAPGLSAADILTALRERLDPAFLPRRLVHVDSLPRDPTGKLPAARLAALAAAPAGDAPSA